MANANKEPRKRRERSTEDYLAFARRTIRAAAARVGECDEWELEQLIGLHAEVDDAIATAVLVQRSHGKSWAAIATATGTTRQAAQQRWGRRTAG